VSRDPAPVPTNVPETTGPVIENYTVRSGDTLLEIALNYDMTVDELMRLNSITDPTTLQVGRVLQVRVQANRVVSADRVIPDSEVVYSPAYADFDIAAVANQYQGYLASYSENVEGEWLTGADIIQRVAERFSVGPRVLLTLLEMKGHWVTQTDLTQDQIDYPMGLKDRTRSGLFFQASWAANRLNEGYYGKLDGYLPSLVFKDKSRARVPAAANPGTVALQNVLAQTATWSDWQNYSNPNTFIADYTRLFGDPYARAIDLLVPSDLQQPALMFPLEPGQWFFTGGPHSAWGDGSAWAAVDFAPNDVLGSCSPSSRWAVAAAPGKIIRVEHGRVVENLAGNDFQGAGWTLLYMHIARTGRVPEGTVVNVGDRIGHPSCEGGLAETSHVHFARLYNGQWLSAGGALPLNIAGWMFSEGSQQYDGWMTRGGETREACNCRDVNKNGVVPDAGTMP
jgi:murein DD-endopeptidase MepM/ murein hydrolase activator NlpD